MDDIVEEVRRIREEYAALFDYDLDAIHRDLVRHQEILRAEGWRIVSPGRGPSMGASGGDARDEEPEGAVAHASAPNLHRRPLAGPMAIDR